MKLGYRHLFVSPGISLSLLRFTYQLNNLANHSRRIGAMMKKESFSPDIVSETSSPETNSRPSKSEPVQPDLQSAVKRRSFLKGIVVAGAAVTAGAAMLENIPLALAEEGNGNLTRGDAAILKWLAAAEIIESDLWLQYQELAGSQDDEVARIASRLIRGYPAVATGGSPAYTNAV